MSTTEKSKLDSNPEILLKKRKNADRLRIEKQQQAKRRAEERQRKQSAKKSSNKFVRAETIVARRLATDREKERIKRVARWDKAHYREDDKKMKHRRTMMKRDAYCLLCAFQIHTWELFHQKLVRFLRFCV